MKSNQINTMISNHIGFHSSKDKYMNDKRHTEPTICQRLVFLLILLKFTLICANNLQCKRGICKQENHFDGFHMFFFLKNTKVTLLELLISNDIFSNPTYLLAKNFVLHTSHSISSLSDSSEYSSHIFFQWFSSTVC